MTAPDFTEILHRVDRAARHRAEMQDLALAHHDGRAITTSTELADGQIRVYARAKDPFPIEISLAFSDWAHQLRSALDAMLYQVSVGDTAQNPPPGDNHLQYPLTENPRAFAKAAKDRLRHLSPEVVAEIESTHPYKIPTGPSGHALWWLHEVARIDRHRLAHEFTWSVRGFTLSGPPLAGARIDHCDEETTFIREGESTLLATVVPAPGARLSPGLDLALTSSPEIPRWHLNAVRSYRQYGLSDRMTNAEEIVRATTQYFADQDWTARGRPGSR